MLSLRATSLGLVSLSTVLLFAFGCNRQGGPKSAEKAEAATFALGVKRATADSIWSAMTASDDRKIENVRYFLKLVSYTNISDTSEVHHIRTATDSLLTLRYTQQNVRDLVDDYDRATDRVVQGVGELFNTQEEMQKLVNAQQLIEEIKAADDSVLLFRSTYDKAADAYNGQLIDDRKAVEKMDGEKPQRLPLFRLDS